MDYLEGSILREKMTRKKSLLPDIPSRLQAPLRFQTRWPQEGQAQGKWVGGGGEQRCPKEQLSE